MSDDERNPCGECKGMGYVNTETGQPTSAANAHRIDVEECEFCTEAVASRGVPDDGPRNYFTVTANPDLLDPNGVTPVAGNPWGQWPVEYQPALKALHEAFGSQSSSPPLGWSDFIRPFVDSLSTEARGVLDDPHEAIAEFFGCKMTPKLGAKTRAEERMNYEAVGFRRAQQLLRELLDGAEERVPITEEKA